MVRMPVFGNQEIGEFQPWEPWGKLSFAPDSSPEAWEHYKKYYSETLEKYAICFPTFFSYDKSNGCYVPKPNTDVDPDSRKCRLYAPLKGTALLRDENGDAYYRAVSRVSGETDFNFIGKNCRRYRELKFILKDEPEYLGKLEKCREQHNCLLNFSLMQTMGNMQSFKGTKCGDRLDTFIYYLNEFYNASSRSYEKGLHHHIEERNKENGEVLLDYLNSFDRLPDYCRKVYFISNKELIDELIEHGQKKLNDAKEVRRYIDLAFRFWEEKESYFVKKEIECKGYDAVGSYFPDGGETYTGEELSFKLINDLGVDQKEADEIIGKCADRGFIHPCGGNCYVR